MSTNVGGYGVGIRVVDSRTWNKFSAKHSKGFYNQDTRPSLWFPTDADSDEVRNLYRDALDREAEEFKQYHDKDVQFVFSRYQHHWHSWDERTKTRRPMKYCLPKSRGVKKKG